ncbi:MAG: c-type cytochrome [Burkholderiaceae bacterium]
MPRLSPMLLACALWLPASGFAQDCEDAGFDAARVDVVAQGGRLYDNWWVTCGLPAPKATHPAYPGVGKQSGAATWRCKECHGWDYRGKDGAYAKGPHSTGIVGIAGKVGRDESDIVAILKNPTHRFDAVVSGATLQRIAGFVSLGQINAGMRIDAKSKKVTGQVAVGKRVYERRCRDCHGKTGRAMNFSAYANEPEFVGTIAVDNPWEALHKIRNGQPGAVMDEKHLSARDPAETGGSHMGGRMGQHKVRGRAMPPMRELLTFKQQNDLLAYLQTLPVR